MSEEPRYEWSSKVNRELLLSALSSIIRRELDDSSIQVSESTIIDAIDGWDSVAHVRIIVAVETHFAIRFDPDEYMDFQTVGEVADRLREKLAGKGAAVCG